jgi:hypothetical protein
MATLEGIHNAGSNPGRPFYLDASTNPPGGLWGVYDGN